MSEPRINPLAGTALQVDPNAEGWTLYDATTNRVYQARAILKLLTGNDRHRELSPETTGAVLWAVRDLLGEAEAMGEALSRHIAETPTAPPDGPG